MPVRGPVPFRVVPFRIVERPEAGVWAEKPTPPREGRLPLSRDDARAVAGETSRAGRQVFHAGRGGGERTEG